MKPFGERSANGRPDEGRGAMTTGGGYRDEDLEFKPVPGGPARYGNAATGPVRYVVIANQDGVIGYLWGSDAEDAAGYEYRRSAGDVAANAGVPWYQKLRSAKARGLRPSQALAEFAAGPGDPVAGRVVPGSEGTAPGLAALKDLAAG
jgi:hypothetical protein